MIRWNNVSGPEKIDAKKYIELLEAEIEELNRQVGRKSANEQNEILEYLKSLQPQNLKAWEKFPKYLIFFILCYLIWNALNIVGAYKHCRGRCCGGHEYIYQAASSCVWVRPKANEGFSNILAESCLRLCLVV